MLHVERVGIEKQLFRVGRPFPAGNSGVISRILQHIPVPNCLCARSLKRLRLPGWQRRYCDRCLGAEHTGSPGGTCFALSSRCRSRLPSSACAFLDQSRAWKFFFVQHPDVLRLSGASGTGDAMQQSLETLVRRHESLRTTFSVVDGDVDSDPVQVIQRAISDCGSLDFVDLTGLSDEPRGRETDRRLIQEESQRSLRSAARSTISRRGFCACQMRSISFF